jgi:hypothetical protein
VPRTGSADDVLKTWVNLFRSVYLNILTHKDLGSHSLFEQNPNQLFDILGYLLTLTIHDSIFAEFGNIEEVYRIEIPPHRNYLERNEAGPANLPSVSTSIERIPGFRRLAIAMVHVDNIPFASRMHNGREACKLLSYPVVGSQLQI